MKCFSFPTAAEWAGLLAGWGDVLGAVSWPVAAFGTVWLFRDQLRTLIPRLRRTVGGTEFAEEQQTTQVLEEKPTGAGTSNFIGLIWPSHREMLEKALDEQIANLNAADKHDYLKSNLILARRALAHMMAERSIFGSQIELLSKMAGAYHGSLTSDYIASIHKMHLDRGGKMTVADWLTYPKHWGLIAGDEQQLTLTDAGRDFLPFVTGVLGATTESRPY